jgi:hypothetical protein
MSKFASSINKTGSNMAEQASNRFYLLKRGILAVSLASLGLLAGCGDDGASSGPAAMPAKIKGVVSNNKGSIHHGKIEVKDKSGMTVANAEFTDGKYSVTVPAGTTYPILLIAHPPADAVLNEPVKAVVTSPIAESMDISGVSTDIVDGAIALGGITMENIAKASGVAINMRQKEGVSAGAGGSGGGPGNSGGGAGKGGHAGHNMDDMRKSSSGSDAPEKQ